MRKKGDVEKAFGGSELAFLKEENVDGREFGVVALLVTRVACVVEGTRVRVCSSHSSVIEEFGSDSRTCTPSSLCQTMLFKVSIMRCHRPTDPSRGHSSLHFHNLIHIPKLGLFATWTLLMTVQPYTPSCTTPYIFRRNWPHFHKWFRLVIHTAFLGLRAITAPL